jgi:RNA polymerase sigma factor (sigma-70 family)
MTKGTTPKARSPKTPRTGKTAPEEAAPKKLPTVLTRAQEIEIAETMRHAKDRLMEVVLRSRLAISWITETDGRKSGVELDKADQLALRKLLKKGDEQFALLQMNASADAPVAMESLHREIQKHLAHCKFQYVRMDGLFEELHRLKGRLKPIQHGVELGEPSSLEALHSLESQLWIQATEWDAFFGGVKAWESAFLAARGRLVEANLRLVPFCANRFRESRMAFEDLVQEGYVSMTLTLENYNPSRSKFSTFATKVIVSAMIRAIDDQGSLIRIPVHACEKLRKIRKRAETLGKDLNRDATDAEIAQACNLDPEKVRELRAAAQTPVSLDSPLQLVEKPDAALPPEKGEVQHAHLQDDSTEKTAQRVRECLAWLSPMEREVVERIFGLGKFEPCSESEAARSLNRTPSQVRDILEKALKTMARTENQTKPHDLPEVDMIGIAA